MIKSAYSMAVIACVMLVFSLAMPEGARAEDGLNDKAIGANNCPPELQILREGEEPIVKPGNCAEVEFIRTDNDATDKDLFVPPAPGARSYRLDKYRPEALPPGKIVFRNRNGIQRLHANDAELGDVFRFIGEKVGVKVLVGDDIKGQKFHGRIDGPLDFDKLEKMVENKFFYIFTYSEDGKVKEAAIGNVPGAAVEHRRIVIPYGDGPGELGADGAYFGPAAFTVDDKGNIYILDMANKRVQIDDKNVKHIGTVPIEEQYGRDVMVDGQYIYIYTDAQPHTITQYDMQGKVISSIRVDPDWWGGIGKRPMYIWAGGLYVESQGNGVKIGYQLIGKLENGKLKEPNIEEREMRNINFMGKSGKHYAEGIEHGGKYRIAFIERCISNVLFET